MQNFFVTGTDTDAGKTVVTAAIISYLLNKNINAVAMKPVQTGCEKKGENFSVPDLDFISKITRFKPDYNSNKKFSPYRYEPACSPHLAAEMAHEKIDLDEIISSYKSLTLEYESVIVEGAGGIMVPVSRENLMLDLMQKINIPIIIATRPGLGTINHTLLSVEVLKNRGLEIAGIVFCATKPLKNDFIERDNIATIEQKSGVKVFGTIPYIDEISKTSFDPNLFKKIAFNSLQFPADVFE